MKKDYPYYETTEFADLRIMTENVARKYPNRVAISYKINPHDQETIKLTYAEAREYIRSIGTGLIVLGCRDQHIALVGETSCDWICTYFALMSIGSVVVPIDKDLPPTEIADILVTAECTAVIYSEAIESKIDTVKEKVPAQIKVICMAGETKKPGHLNLATIAADGKARLEAGDTSYDDYEIDPDRLAAIVFTSGTTGKGKGVMLSQTNIVSDMTNGMYLFAITPKTIALLPPHHTFGSTVIFVGHFAQGSEIYISSGLRYIATEIREQQPSHLIVVPLFLEKLHQKLWQTVKEKGKTKQLKSLFKISNNLRKIGIDLRGSLFGSIRAAFGGKLEMVICGGAALRQDFIDTFDSIGITVLNGYGITECSPLVSCNRNEYQKKGSVGMPILEEKIKIDSPNEKGEGEICVKGPNVMLGYYKDPEATAAAFDADGYFRTGDFGQLDEDGWLYITGRLKNLIVFSNGKNVYPEELEAGIAAIPGVEEVVVYAGESRSQKNREVIVADIFPDYDWLAANGLNAQEYFDAEIRKYNSSVVSYKAIGQVKIRETEFEKNTSRKIVRFAINKQIE
ncbi:MAG: AMP-binding protein [Ruminococcaceae bacterium]|nr:AMP-binding protein [Oscillospiraceae bacterium]